MPGNFKLFLKEIYVKTRKISLRPFLILKRTRLLSRDAIKSILFLRHDRIGDMILSTAALKSLKWGYPHAKITVLASRRNYEVLKHNSYVDEVIIYKGFFRFIKEIRPHHYDLVIDPFVTHEMRQALMTCLASGKYRIGFQEGGREIFFNLRGPTVSSSKQMVDHLLELAALAGGKIKGCKPEVFLSDKEIEWATEALAHKGLSGDAIIIAIHPGAHYPSQRWPAERFGEVARLILEQCMAKVVLLGSSTEEELLGEVKRGGVEDIQIFPCNNIRELIALLNRCDLLVCNNSGPMHIAAALKIPTISMIGPTVTPLWLPYGENHVVINKVINCSPCNREICKGHQCMESIPVDEVFGEVKKQIVSIRAMRERA
jgi:lipopolysaccharide heptosyltransferase II